MADTGRYVLDALYGVIHFPPYVWDLLLSPELQRLREVRMSNINSLTLTGAAGVNRFEHSLGTAHLATQAARASALDPEESRILILSCLLHDIGSAAFGHSVQYVLDRQGYSHESLYEIISGATDADSSFKYQHATYEEVYFGTSRVLPSLLSDNDLRAISEAVSGRGRLGPLVSGTMDLDNVDNVFRLAFHMGLAAVDGTPGALAQSMSVDDGILVIAPNARSLVERWYEIRKTLYQYLLLNPYEFAAKCMLEEAALIASRRSRLEIKWQDVDFRLVDKLYQATDDSRQIVRRLMLGDVYGCLCILSTSDVSISDRLSSLEERTSLEGLLSHEVRTLRRSLKSTSIALHLVDDVGRTERRVTFKTPGGKLESFGQETRRTLIGVFFRNTNLSAQRLNRGRMIELGVHATIMRLLSEQLKLDDLTAIPLYREAEPR